VRPVAIARTRKNGLELALSETRVVVPVVPIVHQVQRLLKEGAKVRTIRAGQKIGAAAVEQRHEQNQRAGQLAKLPCRNRLKIRFCRTGRLLIKISPEAGTEKRPPN